MSAGTAVRRAAVLALTGIGLTLLAACGSGSSGSPSATTAAVASPSVAVGASAPGGGPLTSNACRSASGINNLAYHGSATGTGTVALDAGDQFFKPTCVVVKPGVVKVTIKNTGQALHNITVKDQGIDRDILPGQQVTVELTVGKAPVSFICKYHSTLGMAGALIPQG